jgi:murein DD-endopeptidase MepM/ murein hydrolase activator NlpD
MSGADALTYLLAGTRERRTYRVETGDTIWQIANRHGMSVEEILKANPGVSPERIYPGQSLSLIVPRPLVTVEARYVRVYRRVIPFPVSVTWDQSMYRTERRVDRPGSVGQKEITEQVTRTNGEVTDDKVLREVVLRWPQTQFLTAGTRRTPEDVLGDSLADGEVAQMSSEFGRRWRRMHGGVDWAMPTGTPIRAWRDGTVRVAQSMFGYGRLVILEHSDDYMTYYAHLSRFNVRVGQSVSAGEVIAWSGNTGNSTGPHLHFEVHHRGAHVDPIAVLAGEGAAIGGP